MLKKLGVIGGMGPEATSFYYARVIARTKAESDQEHINMIILSHATMPDRTQAILTGNKLPFLKAITQDALNDVQKEKLSGYFTDMAAIDNDTTLTAEQKVEKKAAAVQTMINSVLGLNYSYKSGVYGTYELTATDLSNPIAISVAGIKAGDTVVVAHLTSAGVWENVPVTNVADGVVYAKFTSLSPVFVASVADTNAAATSPKTADAGMNMAMILVVVIAATGAVVYARRRMNYTK